MSFTLVLVFLIGAFLPIALALKYGLFNRFINCEVTDDRILRVLFKTFRIGWVSISNIKDIRIWESVEIDHWYYEMSNWQQRFYGDYVLIEKKRWILKRFVLLSPEDPAQFVIDIKNRMALQLHTN